MDNYLYFISNFCYNYSLSLRNWYFLGFKYESSKLIVFLVVALIVVDLVFNADGVKGMLLQLFNNMSLSHYHLVFYTLY